MDLQLSKSEDTDDARTELAVDSEPRLMKQEPELVQVWENEPQDDSCTVERSPSLTSGAALCSWPCGSQDETVWYCVRCSPVPQAWPCYKPSGLLPKPPCHEERRKRARDNEVRGVRSPKRPPSR